MNEEKELQEEDIVADEGMEDLSSFVDFADLDELEFTGNDDVFGELGDIADLGEIPDLSVDTLLNEEALEETEEISIPDLEEEESEKTTFHTVEPEEDVSFADSTEESAPTPELDDMPDVEDGISVPDSEEPLLSEPEESSDAESDMPMPESGEPSLSESEESSDAESDMPMPESEEPSDTEGDDIAMLLEPDAENDVAEPDDGMADSISDDLVEPEGEADAPILDDAVSDILAGEDGIADLGVGFADEEEAAPVTEESGEDLDSMLGGLLDDLDMDSSLSEEDQPLGFEDSSVSMDDLDELSADEGDMLGISGMLPEEQKEEKPPGLLKRVFGNVVTDEIAEEERLAAQKEEEEAAKKKEEEEKAKEEAEARKEEKAAEKAAKKEEKKKLKEEKKAEKAAAKEEKKKKKEEAKAAEAAELEVIGKLNKVGVSIIVIATVLFLAAEIAGTNVFGYISTKNKALDYFEMGKYTQAYQEAVGTDMAKKDKEEYDKIKVVMKVQQSLNAYQNYDRINYYPEALDALLRGLKRYDANIDQGIELEVDGDMMSCRKQILTLLQSEFNLSESGAYSILALDSEAYQKKVIELGLKKR